MKLPLQYIWRHYMCSSATMPGPPITDLCPYPLPLHEPVNTIGAATLTGLTKVGVNLPVPVDPTRLQPELLDPADRPPRPYCGPYP